ncbi:MAG: hypothetical protein JST43_05925 [Bacteroidetes bacterium]|nr:hypothetical protein [Bacteroidota bacterium]MBS1539331.1 hypothetical protein [Bacteroidota bacterium]
MKTITNLFSEVHWHVNPINRDLILITIVGLMAAISAFTILVIAVSKF